MRASLAETGVTAQHCHDVLHAFRLDATKLRYRDWDDLMEYCRYSASPVGRQLLDLHGESRDTWPASDALCSALQVLNHLQDCAEDYRDARPRLPAARRSRRPSGCTVEVLTGARGEPGVAPRARLAARPTEALIATRARTCRRGSTAAACGGNRRSIVALAARLARHLRRGDPLARGSSSAKRFRGGVPDRRFRRER